MKTSELLDGINTPRDVKRLRFDQLVTLSDEIRSHLINTVSQTGGHLASNLGVVELSIALHRVFSSPRDRMVFDVGHQCYTHKLLTGRRERFATLRQAGGISGFPKRAESKHDAFIAGHSSTSVSVAVGLAYAKKMRGESGKVIVVIGDGAFSGIVFEALNNLDISLDNLIIILNDNEMSISRNMSMFARHLTKIRNTSSYFQFKDHLENIVQGIPLVGPSLRDGISVLKSAAKGCIYHSNLFEDMGLTYIGPVDGHDLAQLCSTLARAKTLHKPVLIHVHTQKGKGYPQAEENPGAFHGVSHFDPELPQDNVISADAFSEQVGILLTQTAEQEKRLVAITAAMKYATGLHHFSSRFRGEGRFFDVGIAESHAVIFAAALAVGGMIPVFCVYSSFLQRAFDQILHDCSLEPVHVVLGVDRAGLVGEDGETHQGLFDVGFLSMMPGMVIYSPATYEAMRRDFKRAIYEETGAVAVRYPRGRQTFVFPPETQFLRDYARIGEDASCLLITYGRMAGNALEARHIAKEAGCACDMLVLERIHPLPPKALEMALHYSRIVFAEESAAQGGIGEKLAYRLLEQGYQGRYTHRAVTNPVVAQGTLEECMRAVGLDAASIAAVILEG